MKRRDTEALRRVRRIVTALLVEAPFYASGGLRLVKTADGSIPDMATDGDTLYFNPAWVMATKRDEIIETLAHLVTACMLKHHLRRGDRNEEKWQRASYEVRLPIVRKAGLSYRDGGLDLSVEDAYAQMPDPDPMGGGPDGDEQNESESGAGAQGGGDGEGEDEQEQDDNGGGNGPQDADNEGQDDQEGDQKGDQENNAQAGDSGAQGASSAPGAAQAPPGTGMVLDAPRQAGQTEAEYQQDLKRKERDWDMAAQTAASMARAAGSDPGALAELLEAARAPKVDYKELVQRFMRETVKTDYTWKRPNRRHLAHGLYLPSLHAEGTGRVGLLIDSSGSIDSDVLADIWAGVHDAVAQIQPREVVVMHGDTMVRWLETFDAGALPERLDIEGRGGTEFEPLFDALRDLPPVDCALYYTDLFPNRDDFGTDPGCPLMWLVRDNDLAMRREAGYPEPPFGEVVEVPAP